MQIKKNSSKIIFSFLTGLLFISLFCNIALYNKLKRTYLELYKVSLNPLGIDRYSSQNLASAEKTKVVFYGDSRAYQWKSPKIEEFKFINRGINGQTSAQVLGRFNAHIAQLKPQVIVLQVGINDLRMLPRPPQTRKDIVQNCKNNVAEIVELSSNIGANIIVTTMFPLSNDEIPLKLRPFFPSIHEMEQSINEINQYIRTLGDRNSLSSQEHPIIVFDAYSLLNQKDKDKLKYYKDLLHINHKGYELLNQELQSILNEIKT